MDHTRKSRRDSLTVIFMTSFSNSSVKDDSSKKKKNPLQNLQTTYSPSLALLIFFGGLVLDDLLFGRALLISMACFFSLCFLSCY